VVRHKGREAVLTHREFELLQFLLDHPHRFYTAVQITGLAWSERRSSQKKSEITCSVCERFSPVWRFPATWSIDPVAAIR
jgi:DNA-binding winged helix-turn-helix (wHTH) protein